MTDFSNKAKRDLSLLKPRVPLERDINRISHARAARGFADGAFFCFGLF